MTNLKPIIHEVSYDREVFEPIEEYFIDTIFGYLMAVVNEKPQAMNSADQVVAGLYSGRLMYTGGAFYSSTGRFSNSVADQLEHWGAKYNLRDRSFILSTKNLPIKVVNAIAQINIKNEDRLKTMQDYLDDIENSLDFTIDRLDFGGQVNKIIESLDGQYAESVKGLNIIPMKFTPYQMERIRSEYTDNMKLYIRGWTKKEIQKLRDGVQGFTVMGYRADTVKEYIMQEFGHSAKKAEFLAGQENRLLVSKYRQTRYEEAGIKKYKWSTILDGRERDEHKKLNGKIIYWNDPPISDEATGRKAHAGEDFGCRCRAIPIIDD